MAAFAEQLAARISPAGGFSAGAGPAAVAGTVVLRGTRKRT